MLLIDGEYEEVVDLDIASEWSDAEDPVKIHVAVCTENRRVQIEGRVLTLAPLRNRRKDGDQVLVSRIAEGFTEFRWDDRVGYGMAAYIERIEDGKAVGHPL